jgi:diguanylate cyclase (GGDEF)-like protein
MIGLEQIGGDVRSIIQANEFGSIFHSIHSEVLPGSIREATKHLRFHQGIEEAFLRFFVLRTHRLVLFSAILFCAFTILEFATALFQHQQSGIVLLPLIVSLGLTSLLLSWWIVQQTRSPQERSAYYRFLVPVLIIFPITSSLLLMADANQTIAQVMVGTVGVFYTTFLTTLALRLRISNRAPLYLIIGIVLLLVIASTQKLFSLTIDIHAITALVFGVLTCVVLEYDTRSDFLTLAQIYRIATTDPLSRTLNRRALFERAQMEIDRSRRYNGELALLMLDIDHFKQVNDRFGHLIGDQVIAALGDLCRSSLRSSDLLGRVGGEEFVILLPDTDLTAATLVAERLRVAMENHIETATDTLHVTISIGVAALHQSDRLLQEIIGRADSCLYAAKRAGRNCVVTEATDTTTILAERSVGTPLGILTI